MTDITPADCIEKARRAWPEASIRFHMADSPIWISPGKPYCIKFTLRVWVRTKEEGAVFDEMGTLTELYAKIPEASQ